MKLNLECGQDIRNGYKNISSIPVDTKLLHDGIDFCIDNFKQLKSIPNKSVEEINFAQPLNILRANELMSTLELWLSKLTDSGILKVFFLDIRILGLLAHRGDANLEQLHNLIMGPNNIFGCVLDSNSICKALQAIGLKINLVSIDEYICYIEATR